MQYYQLTKYPKIFRGSYWGAFDAEKNDLINEIVENRNRFVEEYNIIKHAGSDRPRGESPLFDHCELYKTRNGYVYITSPYCDVDEEAERFGFKKYLKLYHSGATTYVRVFRDKYAFNRFKK